MPQDDKDFFEKLHPYLKNNPSVMALIPFVLGLIFILTAIFNWGFLLNPSGTFRGLGGITAIFGKSVARVICGLVGILLFIVAYVMVTSKKW